MGKAARMKSDIIDITSDSKVSVSRPEKRTKNE